MAITPHTNGEPLLSGAHLFPSLQRFYLFSGLQTATVVTLTTSKTSSNLLNDDTYRCVCADNFLYPSGQVEQGAHYIRKSLIYSTRKAFLKKVVVELVYKFDD